MVESYSNEAFFMQQVEKTQFSAKQKGEDNMAAKRCSTANWSNIIEVKFDNESQGYVVHSQQSIPRYV